MDKIEFKPGDRVVPKPEVWAKAVREKDTRYWSVTGEVMCVGWGSVHIKRDDLVDGGGEEYTGADGLRHWAFIINESDLELEEPTAFKGFPKAPLEHIAGLSPECIRPDDWRYIMGVVCERV